MVAPAEVCGRGEEDVMLSCRVLAPWRSSGRPRFVSEHQCEKTGRSRLAAGVPMLWEGDFTAVFLAGEDNFLLHFKICFYT